MPRLAPSTTAALRSVLRCVAARLAGGGAVVPSRARHVIRYDRPAFLVRDGRCVAPPADPWRAPLERHRERIERAIACVGRISSSELARRPALGTAWLVRPDVVVTNTHLARYLDARMRSGAMVATVDFIGEHGAPRRDVAAVSAVLYAADDVDLAFMRIGARAPQTPRLLELADCRPGAAVCAIGFPAENTAWYDAAEIARIFGGVFDVKRVAPGTVLAVTADRLDHDCTTLGGNSGSLLLELASGAAVGVHADGLPFVRNHAVPAGVVRERLAALPG
jgi:hypothetical protein